MNDLIKVRKIVTHIENIYHEGGPAHGANQKRSNPDCSKTRMQEVMLRTSHR